MMNNLTDLVRGLKAIYNELVTLGTKIGKFIPEDDNAKKRTTKARSKK